VTPYDVSRILEKLEEMTERLAVLETKLDTHATHDARISNIERWRAFQSGIVALVFFEMQLIALLLALRSGW
jgi:hypothetical protein